MDDGGVGTSLDVTTTTTTATNATADFKTVTALSFKDKFNVLEDRDKYIRLKTLTNTKHMASRERLKGTCPDMCPEKERLMREMNNTFSRYESIIGNNSSERQVVPELLIKEYSRSSADQDEPLSHELRPEPVLTRTMRHLLRNVLSKVDEECKENASEWYTFCVDRLRGIRKDIIQQQLCNRNVVSIIEQCARFHIWCYDMFCRTDQYAFFEDRLNTDNLVKSLQLLFQMYDDLASCNRPCPNEPEFRVYMALLQLDKPEAMWLHAEYGKMERLRDRLGDELAQIYTAYSQTLYRTFFSLIERTSYLNACILQRYFGLFRVKALRMIIGSHCTGDKAAKLSLRALREMLKFDDVRDTVSFLNQCGFRIDDRSGNDDIMLSKTNFSPPATDVNLHTSYNIVKAKRIRLVSLLMTDDADADDDQLPMMVHSSFSSASHMLNDDSFDASDQRKRLLDRFKNYLPEQDNVLKSMSLAKKYTTIRTSNTITNTTTIDTTNNSTIFTSNIDTKIIDTASSSIGKATFIRPDDEIDGIKTDFSSSAVNNLMPDVKIIIDDVNKKQKQSDKMEKESPPRVNQLQQPAEQQTSQQLMTWPSSDIIIQSPLIKEQPMAVVDNYNNNNNTIEDYKNSLLFDQMSTGGSAVLKRSAIFIKSPFPEEDVKPKKKMRMTRPLFLQHRDDYEIPKQVVASIINNTTAAVTDIDTSYSEDDDDEDIIATDETDSDKFESDIIMPAIEFDLNEIEPDESAIERINDEQCRKLAVKYWTIWRDRIKQRTSSSKTASSNTIRHVTIEEHLRLFQGGLDESSSSNVDSLCGRIRDRNLARRKASAILNCPEIRAPDIGPILFGILSGNLIRTMNPMLLQFMKQTDVIFWKGGLFLPDVTEPSFTPFVQKVTEICRVSINGDYHHHRGRDDDDVITNRKDRRNGDIFVKELRETVSSASSSDIGSICSSTSSVTPRMLFSWTIATDETDLEISNNNKQLWNGIIVLSSERWETGQQLATRIERIVLNVVRSPCPVLVVLIQPADTVRSYLLKTVELSNFVTDFDVLSFNGYHSILNGICKLCRMSSGRHLSVVSVSSSLYELLAKTCHDFFCFLNAHQEQYVHYSDQLSPNTYVRFYNRLLYKMANELTRLDSIPSPEFGPYIASNEKKNFQLPADDDDAAARFVVGSDSNKDLICRAVNACQLKYFPVDRGSESNFLLALRKYCDYLDVVDDSNRSNLYANVLRMINPSNEATGDDAELKPWSRIVEIWARYSLRKTFERHFTEPIVVCYDTKNISKFTEDFWWLDDKD